FTSSTLIAIGLALRFSNSAFSFATAPSSVVQTGVKSFGWEKSTAHFPPIQSWNLMRPSVESCSKSGAMSPIRIAIPGSFRRWVFCAAYRGPAGRSMGGLRDEDGRAREASVAQILERGAGPGERVGVRFRADARVGGETQELRAVAPREVRHRAQHALTPETLARPRRDRAHVDAPAHHDSAGFDGGERSRHEVADRREDQRGVERFRRRATGVPGPHRPEPAGELLRRHVTGASE